MSSYCEIVICHYQLFVVSYGDMKYKNDEWH